LTFYPDAFLSFCTEFPLKNDETFIPAEEADEEETSWLEEQQSD
jgi:hypothetical protein